MRTTGQLLLAVDSALGSPLFTSGLCDLIRVMTVDGLLSLEESGRLEDYLWDHAPRGKTTNIFWWEPTLSEPRHKWLRKRIRKERIKDTLKSIGLWRKTL